MKSIITITAFKTKLDPNNVQATKFLKTAGCARFAYNWALNYQQENYKKGNKFIGKVDIQKIFVATVKQENKWLYESSKCAPQQAIRNLDTAYNKFFKGKAKHPKFKKKNVNESFYVEGSVYIKGNCVFIPKIGLVRCFEDLKPLHNIKIKSATIRKENYEWFVSFTYEKVVVIPEKQFKTCGVDLGIKIFAVLSDGTEFKTPKKYKFLQKKIAKLQRKLARQQFVSKTIINKKGNEQTIKVCSKNREKTKKQISLIHRDIKNQRIDVTHKMTTYITKNHSDITIEDLCVNGMMRNHKIARSIANSNFGEIRRQLEYKGIKYGCNIFIADRFFASSKTCSKCGNKKDNLKLSDRTYKCEKCGLVIDRDKNASDTLNNILYMNYEDFSKIVINCTEEKYNELRKQILIEIKNNDEFHRDSLWRPQGFRLSNKSVRVEEAEIKQQTYNV